MPDEPIGRAQLHVRNAAARDGESSAALKSIARRLEVLVVGDDEKDFEIARGLLAGAGGAPCHLTWASSYTDGVAAVVARKHDVCLANDDLAGGSALGFVRDAHLLGARVPIVLLTAQQSRTAELEGRQAGAADVIWTGDLTAKLLERSLRYAVERADTLARVRQSEDKYRLLFDAIPVPTWVVDAETNRFLAANDAAVHQYGYSRDEFLALSTRDILPSQTHGSCRPMRQLKSVEGAETVAWQHQRNDGSLIDVEVSYQEITFEGRLAVLVLSRDVTESVRAGAELLQSQERFRELAAHVRVIFFIIEPGVMRTLYVSPVYDAIFDQTSAYALSTPRAWLERVHPDDRERVLAALSESLFAEVEFRVVRLDGTVRWIRRQASAVCDAMGEVVRIVGTAEDITALRRAQQYAETTSRMEAVGRLAGGVAHDFNNVLTAIMGEANFLLLDLPGGDPRRPGAEEIMKSSRRAADLTRQLLAFSRQQVFDLRPLDVNHLVTNMDKMLRRLLGEDVELSTVRQAELGAVVADAGQIEQVVMNLAVNARDAMPAGGRLTIETANVEIDDQLAALHDGLRAGSYIMLTMTDDGTGMTEQVKKHIFEPFFTTKGPGEGTGLGLATVYGIVKQSCGYIMVYSELGVGTTFKVYLPRVRGTEGIAPAVPHQEDATHGWETILVVEDDAAVLTIAVRVLERHGYSVLQAPSGEDAIEIARAYAQPIHAIITDIVMPKMTGPQVAAILRDQRPELRVLYMSGYTDRAIVHQQRLEESRAFLQKPFTPLSLVGKLREVLDAP
jgi:two-component system, cell cycle sensor histidine kinase and response regulator CckA